MRAHRTAADPSSAIHLLHWRAGAIYTLNARPEEGYRSCLTHQKRGWRVIYTAVWSIIFVALRHFDTGPVIPLSACPSSQIILDYRDLPTRHGWGGYGDILRLNHASRHRAISNSIQSYHSTPQPDQRVPLLDWCSCKHSAPSTRKGIIVTAPAGAESRTLGYFCSICHHCIRLYALGCRGTRQRDWTIFNILELTLSSCHCYVKSETHWPPTGKLSSPRVSSRLRLTSVVDTAPNLLSCYS